MRLTTAVHPGEFLAEELAERGITQRAFAAAIARPEQAISEIVAGKKRITARTACQFADELGISAEAWMRLQAAYDLDHYRQLNSL